MQPLYLYLYNANYNITPQELHRLVRLQAISGVLQARASTTGETVKYMHNRFVMRPDGWISIHSDKNDDVQLILCDLLEKLQLLTTVEKLKESMVYVDKLACLKTLAYPIDRIHALFDATLIDHTHTEPDFVKLFVYKKWSVYNHGDADPVFKQLVMTLLMMWNIIGMPVDILIDNVIPYLTLGVKAAGKIIVRKDSAYSAWGDPADITYTINLIKREIVRYG